MHRRDRTPEQLARMEKVCFRWWKFVPIEIDILCGEEGGGGAAMSLTVCEGLQFALSAHQWKVSHFFVAAVNQLQLAWHMVRDRKVFEITG